MPEDCNCSLQDDCLCNVRPKGFCGEVSDADWAVVHETECFFPVMAIGCHWTEKCPAAE